MFLFLLIIMRGITGQYRQRPYPIENFPIEPEVHQGNLCGPITNYVVTAQPQVLKSPYYPASFHAQTQCMWTARTADPKARIKIVFNDWSMPVSGDGCMTTYFQVMDGSGLEEETGITGNAASVKLCGRNPGYIVTGSHSATLTLHADESGAGILQKFRLSMSVTYERPRMLDYDGHAVSDGRPRAMKTLNVPKKPVARFPSSPVGSAAYPRAPGPAGHGPYQNTALGATFQGASYGYNPPSSAAKPNFPDYRAGYNQNQPPRPDGTNLDNVQVERNEISKIGLIFIYIAVILSLIVIAIVIRKRVERKQREKSEESDEAPKPTETKSDE